jgi:hypothetical protein
MASLLVMTQSSGGADGSSPGLSGLLLAERFDPLCALPQCLAIGYAAIGMGWRRTGGWAPRDALGADKGGNRGFLIIRRHCSLPGDASNRRWRDDRDPGVAAKPGLSLRKIA